jgi:hypothetical protein
VLGLIIAFVLGGVAGYAYARWAASPARAGAKTASTDARGRPSAPVVAPIIKPNKKARRVGLTEADFTPSDDILERLRRAEAGELDPAVLADDGAASPAAAEADEPKPRPASPGRPSETPVSDPQALAEAERRVLERLRRMAGQESETNGEE